MNNVYTEAEAQNIGRAIAAKLEPGDAIGLSGELGAGKTTLARSILAGFGVTGDIPSPSFSIIQPYGPPEISMPLWHVDLYRIERDSDLEELGLDEFRRIGAMLIEWPERLSVPWTDMLRLEISSFGAARRLTAHVPQAWVGRWPAQ
jgi:tRNA threonylcarbamoyladenosine biosynthesis protein TsaE